MMSQFVLSPGGLILLVDNTWGARQKNAFLTYMQEEGEMVNPLSA